MVKISVEKSVVVCVIRVSDVERDFKFACPTGDRALAAFLARELESHLVMYDGEVTQEEGGVCHICGCTDDMPCISEQGQVCTWTDETRTLCTACVEKAQRALAALPVEKDVEPGWLAPKTPEKPGSPMREHGEKSTGGGHTKEKIETTTNATVQAFADNLRDVGRMPKKADKEAVLLIVSEYYGISGATIKGGSHDKETVKARHLVVYLCTEGLGISQVKMSKFLGMAAPSTCLALKALRQKFLFDTRLKNEAEGLLQFVKSLPKE